MSLNCFFLLIYHFLVATSSLPTDAESKFTTLLSCHETKLGFTLSTVAILFTMASRPNFLRFFSRWHF